MTRLLLYSTRARRYLKGSFRSLRCGLPRLAQPGHEQRVAEREHHRSDEQAEQAGGEQAALWLFFTVFLVFRLMGRDYEAAVMCARFGGITLGSTATAIANMAAVTHQYGNAHRAMIVVSLVCGFFIDLVNALIINAFVSL